MIRSTRILDVARGRGRAMGSIARSNAIARGRRGGGCDRRPVEGRRRRTRAIERAIDRDPTVGRGEDMVCGWGVCVCDV